MTEHNMNAIQWDARQLHELIAPARLPHAAEVQGRKER
jgi:hypothetical protein